MMIDTLLNRKHTPDTSSMNEQPIIIEDVFPVPVETVWRAITDNDQMKQWYFSLDAFRPEKGFEFQFEGSDGKQTFLHLCRITEVIPNKKLSHTWRYEGQPEETQVTFELFDEDGKTRLRLTHEGLEKIAHHGPAFAKENFVEGWKGIVGTSLKNHLGHSS